MIEMLKMMRGDDLLWLCKLTGFIIHFMPTQNYAVYDHMCSLGIDDKWQLRKDKVRTF